jgi:hypothetical protein
MLEKYKACKPTNKTQVKNNAESDLGGLTARPDCDGFPEETAGVHMGREMPL